MRRIKVVGGEDPFQQLLLHNVEAAVKDLGCGCEIEVIHDMKDIMRMETEQMMVTPALIVDSHILCEGHLWTIEHIKHFLNQTC